jgi:hypothetical protein
MPQYLDSSCRCPRDPYTGFDALIRRELVLPLSVDLIVNQSKFCTMIQKDSVEVLDELSLRDLLHGLGKRVGVYHLWKDEDSCDVHSLRNLQCIYVGKGSALTRLLDHMSDALSKDEGLVDPETVKAVEKRRADDRKRKRERFCAHEPYWISFFDCENRIAKYVEQLFLDIYRFPVNTNENSGVEELWASWGEERYTLGTEMHNVANRPNAPQEF